MALARGSSYLPPMIDPELRKRVLVQAQCALTLNVAYVGIVGGLLDGLERLFGENRTVPIAGFSERMGFIASWIPMRGWSWCANPATTRPPRPASRC